MKKLAVALLTLCVLFIAACAPYETQTIPVVAPVETQEASSLATIRILPSHVFISNFNKGDTAEWPINIYNGTDKEVEMIITYMVPTRVAEGYAYGTMAQASWFSYEGNTTFAPYESRDVLAILKMPKEATAPANKWEFWVNVTVATGETINYACACKWRVDMK